MACAMDYYYTFYDSWVARDRNGDALRSHYPHIVDPETRQLLKQNQATPVNSCWNGITVMRASPFATVRSNNEVFIDCNCSTIFDFENLL